MAKDSAQGFGARLAEMRKAAGFTQTELAETLGMSQRMVAYYESIDDNPLARILVLLSKTLKVSTDELLGAGPVRPTTRRSAAKAKSVTRKSKSTHRPR
jgi:transcriptional regulator with XRE-family HTH domain